MTKRPYLLVTATFFAFFTYTINAQTLKVNEFMASNATTIADEFGEYDDWIEIFNYGAQAVDIGGFYITDRLTNPAKHLMPTGNPATIIPPGGFLLLWADGQPEQGILHLGFKLSKDGEAVAIVAPDGVSFIDSITFGPQTTDISYGRYPNGNDNWVFFPIPTPGASNVLSSIDGFSQNNALIVYPNPVVNTAYMNKTTDVEVFSISGVYQYSAKQVNEIDFSSLPKGLYVIRTSDNQFFKIIKQ
jgi:hypothetical protein